MGHLYHVLLDMLMSLIVGSIKIGQKITILDILTNLNERNTDKPCTPSKPNSSNDNATIMKSNMFQPSWK